MGRVDGLLRHVGLGGGDGGRPVVLDIRLLRLHGDAAVVEVLDERRVAGRRQLPAHRALLEELVEEGHLGGGTVGQHWNNNNNI